jgi:hypothetical protein
MLDDVHRVHTSVPCSLQNQQPYWARTHDHRGITAAGFGQLQGMKRNAQWLEESSALCIEARRQWMAAVRRHDNPLTKTSVIREEAAEAKSCTKIRMAAQAQLTRPARLSWINRHASTWHQISRSAISDALNHASEFVTQDQRGFIDGSTYSSVKVCVKIAAADSSRTHPNCYVPFRRGPGLRQLLHSQILRTV